MHFSTDTRAQWVRNSLKSTLGYKMKSNGFARPDEESFIDKVHMGHLPTGPGAPASLPWSKA